MDQTPDYMSKRDHYRDEHIGLREASVKRRGLMTPDQVRRLEALESAKAVVAVGDYATKAELRRALVALQQAMQGDHGGLAGLADDDHAQYLPLTGVRDMTGDLALTAGKKLIFNA